MARNDGQPVVSESFDFLINDTETEIDTRYCLPYVVVERVALDFLRDGRKSPAVSWEGI
jgi:hypothetical protein